jgi:hypothetical protein
VISDHWPIEEASGCTVPIAKISKNGGNHPASNITIDFYIWGVTYLLKNQSYMYKTGGETDLRLLLIIRRVTIK